MIGPYLAELHSLTGEGESSPTEYRYLAMYWSEQGRRAFVVEDQGEIVGFVLVRAPESTGTDSWELAEFYIRPDARRRGLGMAAAQEVWRRNPGSWEVRVSQGNRGAVAFWSQAVQQASGTPRHRSISIPEADGRVIYRLTVPKPPN